jgi:protocatechuate 3,4-dioxygenase beta subunit
MKVVLNALVLASAIAAALCGQTASLGGRALDTSGASISGAMVEVRNNAT